jgi:uncharacterized repeat protein (TIGR01451 family)
MAIIGCCTVAQAEPITRFARYAGNINFVATGGSLRTESNSGNFCAVGSSSSQALSGIPVGATVKAAYLYWGGSGTTVDAAVSLNGVSVNADRTFTTTSGGNAFFGGFADVTSRVSGNGLYSFGNLTVNTGDPWCAAANVMAGWALIIVYESSSERLRAINIFDGLDSFFGSAITLTPDGFRIPATGIDGRIAVVTWEGDPGNSGTQNGFSESLVINGDTKDDGIVVPGSVPTIQPFDGSINSQGVSDSYGVDVDTYDISNDLSPGQTSATSLYSAGGDRVFLAAQIVSVTSEPLVDLAITKTHTGNFVVGTNASYTINVSNGTGVQAVDFPITVTDVLPAGLGFVAGAGTGWSCSAAGQTVSCVHAAPLASGASLPALTLTVSVANTLAATVSNTATVASVSFDPVGSNNTATDVATVVRSNLSTSAKSVQDLNGGDADPGDVLRYTITLTESAGLAATGVSVTDDVPANVGSPAVVSLPVGATNATLVSGGANGNGLVDIRNISVPAGGSVSIVFDVAVTAGTSPGAQIANTASITNPVGIGATAAAQTLTVSASKIAGSGVKPLYLWGTPPQLSRTPPGGTQATSTIAALGGAQAWTSTPVLRKSVTLVAGNFPVRLLLASSGSSTGSTRTVAVKLSNSVLGDLATTSQGLTLTTTAALQTFTLNLPASVVAPAGSTFTLTVTNNTANAGRSIVVTPFSGVTFSRVELNSATVINVDSVQAFTAAFPGGALSASFTRGSTVYVRAVASDPFGSFDIAGAALTIRDPAGTIIVNAAAMTMVADSGLATRTYEYAYALPALAPAGGWTMSVTAREGTEGTVTDVGNAGFVVSIPQPALQVKKVSEVLSDPFNNAVNPKRIPGSVQRYTVTITNAGSGTVDAGSLVILDVVPGNSSLYVSSAGGNPVEFIEGTTLSGLSFNYGTDVSYSSQPGGGAPFNYVPTADADGVDANVTGLRVAPQGTMSAAAGAAQPSFSVRLRVRVR